MTVSARVISLFRKNGFILDRLGGNVTGFVRDLRGGKTIIVQNPGYGRAPHRLTEPACAYWIGRRHSEPLREVCGTIQEVLLVAGKKAR